MKLLAIHGIGRHDDKPDTWQPLWRQVITDGITKNAPAEQVEVAFLVYDDLFEPYLKSLRAAEFATAAWNLASSALPGKTRGLFELSDSTRWYAGMVVVFVNRPELREELRKRLTEALNEHQPDIIAAHSLGSLLAYDLLGQDDAARKDRTFITLGSQLGNPFVRNQFAGRVGPFDDMPWLHLHNPKDLMFEAALDFGEFQTEQQFQQIVTDFGDFATTDLSANHHAVNEDDAERAYLSNQVTRERLWPQFAGRFGTRGLKPVTRLTAVASPTKSVPDRPKKRALLVGINQYAKGAPALEGCVNDVFLVSSVLQECDFDADDIRVVLDDRATTAAIQERLHWLLDATRPGDIRFFYYSGHGALLPIYGPEGQIDRTNPCLVPHDFAWTKETAITDDTLLNYYSQLPYESRFMMVLDCCHSGGLTRGTMRPRGLEPPDDIRHRLLEWDKSLQMWKQRKLPPPHTDLAKLKNKALFIGQSDAEYRLGRAISLRTLPNKEFKQVSNKMGHQGPYLPIVYEACGVDELAYEYQHGVIGHGAFTFAVASVLRRSQGKVSYNELVKETAKVLKDLGYDQHPVVVGPKDVLKKAPPWRPGPAVKKVP